MAVWASWPEGHTADGLCWGVLPICLHLKAVLDELLAKWKVGESRNRVSRMLWSCAALREAARYSLH